MKYFDEFVMSLLQKSIREKCKRWMDAGAKWIICDDGPSLIAEDGVLILRVSYQYYLKQTGREVG